ncbi:sucrose-6-phosphate hydrolase [Alkalihalophilus lindianensis]|uniref:Sucrose-6-phosphate hydrolase n=1 Tax=Alkalihalophilus lindianensis TaxID=1630542 RepID=A0ABU3X864_9BACI|nr:sucrose-6-phosphate hydrolase [Alkalihalophilus lindianensis]MDV2684083.1 sucrose-6-phosphate hydrolase [Alkalihalophilus lindianensis]
MTWSREERYRKYRDVSEKERMLLKKKVNACPWRQSFHIQPPTGLLNDPNGFAYFNGEYHLFYQWFPHGPVHGLKHWYHVTSTDMVNWQNKGLAIEPNEFYESHGAFSGSGIVDQGDLYLFYTGNTRDEEWHRHPYQCMAKMTKENELVKAAGPIISSPPKGYTEHVRDPKVWKTGSLFYMIIGAQREDKTGCVLLYQSRDIKEWEFLGEVITKLDAFGYMWECPDYIELDHKGILIFSPQGIEAEGDLYNNIYQSGYLVGWPLNRSTMNFDHGPFQELDRGFDFYAPQTTLSEDGRRIMIGWMGLPEMNYPTDENGWAHCLTLPRELVLKDEKLIQRPVRELANLRSNQEEVADQLLNERKSYPHIYGTTYELEVEFEVGTSEVVGIEFRTSENEKTIVHYNHLNKKITLDRSESGKEVGTTYGTTRAVGYDGETITFHLFVDVSSCEVFINDGEEVFTSRIFPSDHSTGIQFFAQGGQASFQAKKWDLSMR